jgi:hypothetical protein
MSPIATIFAGLGGVISVVLFVWKSRDFYKEALNDARANKLPPQKCITMAITYTTLLWLLILGSFFVFGVTAVKADSLLFGLMTMAIWVIVLIGCIIKLTRSMPVKARDFKNDRHA